MSQLETTVPGEFASTRSRLAHALSELEGSAGEVRSRLNAALDTARS